MLGTVTSGGHTLWRFLAVRPGASSGTNGSGIELRYVDYRGKRVLYHAHVPILNVEYGADGQAIHCGPTYRDWQNAETPFEANGTAVAPGFLLCPQPARTIIHNNTDAGNFAGVAIYVDGSEVVLVSEIQAGWYRYITEWRLHANGTIRPRFGFAGTQNPCTCHLHTHHVYWRLDFDIRTPAITRSRSSTIRRSWATTIGTPSSSSPPRARRAAQAQMARAQHPQRRGLHDRAWTA